MSAEARLRAKADATKQSSSLNFRKASWIASLALAMTWMGLFENRGFLLAITDLYLVKRVAPGSATIMDFI